MGVALADERLEGGAVAGVDTHADTHWPCVLGELGRVATSAGFPAAAGGHAEPAAMIGGPGTCAAVGAGGTRPYGAGLTGESMARGFTAPGVPRPKRDGKRGPGEGRGDAGDAGRAARGAPAGKVTPVPKRRGGWVDEPRALDIARDGRVRSRGESPAAARPLVSTAPDGQRRGWGGMPGDKVMSAMAATDEGAADTLGRSPPSVARVRDAAREGAETPEGEVGAIVGRSRPAPLAVSCCGVDDAAALAMAAGEDVSRFKDEAGSAERCGTAPVPAPSGKASGRVRLDRGGDRGASSALRLIVTCGIRFGPETQRHMERRCSGKGAPGKKEAIRRLRRYVARVALRALTRPRRARAWARRAGPQGGRALGWSQATASRRGDRRHCRMHQQRRNRQGQQPTPSVRALRGMGRERHAPGRWSRRGRQQNM